MSRPHGTWLVKEREAFLQGTNAHNIWTYYDSSNERFKAFRVVVTGMKDGKVLGELYPFNYSKQVLRIKAAALPVDRVEGQCANGTEFDMPYTQFNSIEGQTFLYASGGVKSIRYHPKDESELTARIIRERHMETHGKKARDAAPRNREPSMSDR